MRKRNDARSATIAELAGMDKATARWFRAMLHRWPDSQPYNLLRNERRWERRRARNAMAKASRRRNR